MLFTFAGSSHPKYANYLLETVCNLELESGTELRDAILKSMLVSLSGKEGSFSAADFIQEYFNRLLEAIVEKKGVEYGAHFIRNIISRNLHHFARIKLDLRNGVGLAKRSGRHTAPHLRPEVTQLLAAYRDSELHSRRPGRMYDDRDVDDFQRGLIKLRNGKLKKWVMDTTRTRNLCKTQDPPAAPMDEDEDEEPEDDSLGMPEDMTIGFMEMVDGELRIETSDRMDIDDLIEQLEQEAAHENDENVEGDEQDVMDID